MSHSADQHRRQNSSRTLALSLLLGGLSALLAPAAHAQAAPQTLPYIHTIAAGNGLTYIPATTPANPTTAAHGSTTGDGAGGQATAAPLATPTHIAVDSLGNIYITDQASFIRKIDTTGVITDFAGGIAAGTGGKATCPTATVNVTIGDGCPANEALLSTPYGIAIDPATGDIYVSENKSGSYRVRKINHATYAITTVADAAGTKTASAATANGDLATCAAPQTCSGTQGTLNGPRGLAVDKHGNLYILDEANFAIRLANFTTGQLTTVLNTVMIKAGLAGGATCAQDATPGITAGATSLGVAGAMTFDGNDNLYIADSTCDYVFKVAENPSTHMVDGGSIVSVVLGDGPAGATQTTFTNQLGTTVTITPGGVVADPLGNLYVGENTGNHVWFWDHATGYMHTVYGGGTAGSCFGVASSGTSPYNGCDGIHSGISTTAGTLGLALDAWGNLYITDQKSFYVHKLSLGTNAPVATTPSGNPNALLHFGANDTYASISAASAPDFTFAQQTCSVNSSTNTPAGDNTQDCGYIATNSTAAVTAQYEQVTVTSTAGKSTAIPLTNQAYPTCQAATAASKSAVIFSGTANVTLSFTPGLSCTGYEAVQLGGHTYSYNYSTTTAHGTLAGTAPNLVYTPTAGYTGSDSFTYTVTDNNTFAPGTVTYDSGALSVGIETPTPLVSNTATVTLPLYVAPSATPQSVTVTYNTAKPITLAGTDSNGATLTYAVVVAPTHGSLSSGTVSTPTYTPFTGYFGSDSFTFTVNDGLTTSPAATVTITDNPPPPTPTTPAQTVTYQTATTINLTATELDSSTITYAVATQPTHGTLTGTAPNLTYSPTSPSTTYSGPDSFTYTVTNAGGSAVGSVAITVGAPPALPVAQPANVTVVNATATPITVIAGGGTGTLTYSVVTGPTHGTVGSFTGATITYTPTGTYSGNDSFTYKVTDTASHTSNTATVSIFVTLAPPVATNQSLSTPFATALTPITLSATGPGTLAFTYTQPSHGSVAGTGTVGVGQGPLTYTPQANYAGPDSFTFKANNGSDSNTGTINITVVAPPVPTVSNSAVTVVNATAKTFTVPGSGLGTLVYTPGTGAGAPSHGSVTNTGSSFTYTPTGTYFGADSFTYTVTNPGGTSVPATVSVTVLPVPPVAQAQTVGAAFNSGTPVVTTTIPLVATGNGTITYAIVTNPVHGSVSVVAATGVATYTPTANYSGADSFTFKANNGSDSNTATVSITVVPSAAAQTVTVYYQTPIVITLAAAFGTGTYAVTQPLHGSVTLAANKATYTPFANFAGTDSFTFTITNAGGPSLPATVSLSVIGGYAWSVAPGGSFSATVTNGSPATYNLLLSGWTGSTNPVSFGCAGAPFVCTITPNPGTLTGTATIPVTLSVATNTTSVAPVGFSWIYGSSKMRPWVLMLNLIWLALLVPLARKHKALFRVAIACMAVIAITGMTGCGRNIPEKQFGSATGTYSFYIIANDGVVPQAQSTVPGPCLVPAGTPVPYPCTGQALTLIIQ